MTYDNKNGKLGINSSDGLDRGEFNTVVNAFANKVAEFLVDGKIDDTEINTLMGMAGLDPKCMGQLREGLESLLPQNNGGKLFSANDLTHLSQGNTQQRQFAGIKMEGVINSLVDSLRNAGFNDAKLGNLPAIAKGARNIGSTQR